MRTRWLLFVLLASAPGLVFAGEAIAGNSSAPRSAVPYPAGLPSPSPSATFDQPQFAGQAIAGKSSAPRSAVPYPAGLPSPSPNATFDPPQFATPPAATANVQRARARGGRRDVLARIAQLANECQLSEDTYLESSQEMDFSATAACNGEPPPGGEVQECPQKYIGGKWYTENTDCEINNDDGPTWLGAYKVQNCAYNVTFRTWGWDWLPGFNPVSVTGTSGNVVCK
jgi:hypothetical protein